MAKSNAELADGLRHFQSLFRFAADAEELLVALDGAQSKLDGLNATISQSEDTLAQVRSDVDEAHADLAKAKTEAKDKREETEEAAKKILKDAEQIALERTQKAEDEVAVLANRRDQFKEEEFQAKQRAKEAQANLDRINREIAEAKQALKTASDAL